MVAPSAGGSRLPWQHTPTTNPFFTNSKKIRRSKHATNTHKHGRGSYLSDGTRGDSQSPVEADPLRSKNRGFFSYNIDMICLHIMLCNVIFSTNTNKSKQQQQRVGNSRNCISLAFQGSCRLVYHVNYLLIPAWMGVGAGSRSARKR